MSFSTKINGSLLITTYCKYPFSEKHQNCPNKKLILGGQFSTSKSGALPKNWLVKKILEGVCCWANEAEQNKMGPEMGVIFAFQ